MPSFVYNTAKQKMLAGFNWDTADVRCLLLDNTTTTPTNPDHDFVSNIVADEMADASYARQTLTTSAATVNDTDDRAEADASDITFASLENGGVAVIAAVLFVFVTTDADSWLLSYHDIADTIPNGTNFVLQPGTTGVLHVL